MGGYIFTLHILLQALSFCVTDIAVLLTALQIMNIFTYDYAHITYDYFYQIDSAAKLNFC
jgi:hypothetical protein